MAFTIKQGDTSPALVADLKTPDRQPANLVGATVRFHMRNKRRSGDIVDQPAAVTDAANGQVRYDWQTGDTGTAGEFEVEFEATYADGTIETFPNKGYIDVTIPEQIA
jgi:hypothetical protein